MRSRLQVSLEGPESQTVVARPVDSKIRAYFLFFIVSGFSGLVYEVVWLRLAMASFGVTTALTAIVLSVFMAGLGLGSWGAGIIAGAGSANPRRNLRLYALAELLVGVSSLAVPFELRFGRVALEHMGAFAGWQSSRYYMLVGAWLAVSLVPWCTCMGATFPLLMAVIRGTAPHKSDRSFSYLYVANVLGALLGTLISAFVLIEMFGFRGTLVVAGVLNTFLAASALVISLGFRLSSQTQESRSRQQATAQNLYGLSGGSVLSILFTTGLVCMGMEVVWIRQFTPYLGNVVYAFAGIVAVYLLATVIGSHDYRSWVRTHAPEESISSWSLLGLFAIVPLIAADPSLEIKLLEPELGVLRLFAIFLFCALAGFLTPLLVDTWSSGDPRKAGTAYAVNIIGCIVGPLVAGFWLLRFFGERNAVLLLSIPLFGIAALTAFSKRSMQAVNGRSRANPKRMLASAAIVSALIYSVSHDFETRYKRREVLRDYAATVIATGEGFDRKLIVNGFSMTSLNPVTKYMAHLPLAYMSRPPRNGLVICFGMGTTFRSMLSWGIRVTAVDLVPSVPAMFGYYHSDAAKLLENPTARIIIDDGRRFLDGTTESYDVIVTDPPPPTAAPGSSLLYSCEFYAVVKEHLRRDGILQVWYPLVEGDPATGAAVAKALRESFPYVRAFPSFTPYGIHFLASLSPLLDTSSGTLASRMPIGAARDFVEWGPESTAQSQFNRVLSGGPTVGDIIARDPNVPAIHDDEPINEYCLLRYWLHYYR